MPQKASVLDRLTDAEIDDALRVCAEAQEAMDAFLAAGATAKMIERPLETVARMVLPRALAELKEAREDTERLDYLERELLIERAHPSYTALFRRNLPITRATIDEWRNK